MAERKGVGERRKHTRYLVRYGTFFVHGVHWEKPGEIVDISKNGLSCCYFGERRLNEMNETGKLYDNDNFCLEDISLKTVSDCEIANSSVIMRRRGIQFGELNRAQKTQLEEFIRDYAIAKEDTILSD